MLEALKQFDWATLEGDPSPHVPIWLVALTSTVKEESSRANAKLSDYLIPWQVLEWGMYNSEEIMASIDREVIIVTIPFLIKLACSGEITDTAGILEILHDLVCYSGIEERIAQVVLVKYRYLARRIYDEVDKGSACYQLLTQSNEKWVKITATDVLEKLEKYRNAGGIQDPDSA